MRSYFSYEKNKHTMLGGCVLSTLVCSQIYFCLSLLYSARIFCCYIVFSPCFFINCTERVHKRKQKRSQGSWYLYILNRASLPLSPLVSVLTLPSLNNIVKQIQNRGRCCFTQQVKYFSRQETRKLKR